MELFQLMNNKLQQGWKMTDGSCAQCNSLVLFNPKDNTYNCIKCRGPVKLTGAEHEDQQHEQKEHEYQEDIIRRESLTKSQSRSDQVSKLMSAKLLQGWAMLEKACDDCNVPLMRSKQGDQICCGCQRNYKQKPKEPEPSPPKKPEPAVTASVETTVAAQPKKPVHLQQPRGTTSANVKQSSQKILGLATQFYEQRMEQAISRKDETEVSRILQSVKEVVTISNLLNGSE